MLRVDRVVEEFEVKKEWVVYLECKGKGEVVVDKMWYQFLKNGVFALRCYGEVPSPPPPPALEFPKVQFLRSKLHFLDFC